MSKQKRKNILTPEEITLANQEGVDLKELKEVKEGYLKAMGELRKVISSEKIKNSEIIYKPSIFFRLEASAAVDRKGRMEFSYPNSKFKFDYFPTLKSKIGVVAHELFGHPADDEQYYPRDYKASLREFLQYTTPEERANLRAFHALPEEIYGYAREIINSNFKEEKIKIPKNKKTDELLENLYALEFLGRCGLERSHDPVEFFREFYEETGIPVDKLLEEYLWLSLAGLATSPEMNEDYTYGIRRVDDLMELQWDFAEALRKNNKNYRPQLITKAKGYSPLNAVDLRWIRKERALKNFDGALKGWEKKRNKYKGVFPYWEDIYSQAVEAKERVKREL